MTDRQGESGNIFFTLFGAIALIGIIGVATATLMRGPVGTVVALNMRTKVDTQLQIARKLAALDALNQPNGGDCDNDGYVEPSPPDVASQGCATLIAGGGCLPTSVGAARTDPWGTLVGYCGWNHGPTTSGGSCSSDLRIGTNANNKTVIAIISAGPDRVFQTQCKDDPDYVVTAHGSDDIVESWTFEEAQSLAGGGLWVLQSGNPNAITTTKQVDISKNSTFASGTTATFQGSAAFNSGSQLNLSNGGLFLLPDDTKLTTCNVANNGLLRRFTQNGKQLLQICNGTGEKPAWINVGGAGDDLYIDQLADAVSDITAGANLFLGNNGGNLISGAAQNVAVGVNAGQNVTSGKNNVLLGYNAGSNLSAEHDDILIGDNMQAPAGKNHYISIGNLIYGDTALGRIGINNAAPGSALDVGGDIHASGGGAFGGGVSGSGASFGGALSVGGTSTLTGAIDAQGGIANSTGDLNLNDNVDISGTASVGSTLTANGDTTVGGSLGVGGNTALGSNLTVMGNAIMSGGIAAPSYEIGTTGSGIGLYSDAAGGLQFATGATKRVEVTADGKVGIGVATPAARLDVGGAIKVGQDNAAICGAAMYGAIRYSSAGDRLQQCSSTNKWISVGGGGGGGGTAAGTYWIQNPNGTLYYLPGDVGVGTVSPLAPLDVAGELSVTGSFTGTAVTPYTGAGTRMFFDPASAAFRAGGVSGSQWNSGSIGDYSAAFGSNDTASGADSFAAGTAVTASGVGSTGLGSGVQAQGAGSVALGSNAVAAGDHSFAFGLTAATGTAFANVSGTDSLGIFMQDQHNVVLSPSNTMALFGGQMIIDPASPATMLTLPNSTIGLGVNAGIAATQFCDTDGTNCFTADEVAGGQTGAPGADTDIIYNSGGKLGADSGLVWDRTTGRLGVGTTTPLGKAAIENSSDDGVSDFTHGLVFQDNNGNQGSWTHAAIWSVGSIGWNGNLVFGTDGNGIRDSGVVERARITPAGAFGIGTEAPATLLDVAGTMRVGDGGESCASTVAGGIRYAAGTLQYCDGTAWETISSSAVGGNPWSSLTNPTANLALAMAAYTTTWTAGAATTGNVFTMQDTAGNSGTGYLLNVATAPGSSLKPFHVGAAGTDALTVLANGYVGIGTAAPATKLEVSGNAQIDGEVLLSDGSTSSTIYNHANTLEIHPADGAATAYFRPNATSLALGETIGSDYLNDAPPANGLLVEGKTGIGTPTPATELDVAGTVRIANGNETCNAAVAGGIRYISGIVQYCDSMAWQTISSSGAGGVAAAGTTGQVQFNNNNLLDADANFFWDNADKRMGIGTDTPSSTLSVVGDVQASPSGSSNGTPRLFGISNLSTGQAVRMNIGTEGGLQVGWGEQMQLYAYSGIDIHGGTTSLTPPDFVTGTTGAYSLKVYGTQITTGSLGVGMTSVPIAGLDLQAPITAASGVAYGARMQQTLTAAANNDVLYGLYINPAYSDAGKTSVTHRALSVVSSANSDPNVYITKANSGAANENGGSLVFENIGPLNTGRNAGTVGGTILFNYSQPSNGTEQTGAEIQSVVDGGQSGVQTPALLAFSTFNAATGLGERMRITNQGTVGIGTTNPQTALDVVSNQAINLLGLQNTDTSGFSALEFRDDAGLRQGTFGYANSGASVFAGNVYFSSNTATAGIIFGINAAEKMRISTAGMVGIGQTAPATLLDVNGTVRIADGGETCGSTIAGGIRYTAGDLQYCDGTAWQTISSTSGTGGVAAAGTTGEVQFNNNGVLDADANYFWDNTNKRLGIGTTAPVSPLDIARANGPVVTMQELGGTYYDADFRFTNASGALGAEWGVSEHLANSLFEASNGSGVPQLTVSSTGQVGLGLGTTGATAGLDVQTPVTAASQVFGERLQQTLTANAAGTALYALFINPDFEANGNTGTTNYDIGFGRGAARTIAVQNNASTAGNSLTLQAGGTAGGTNIAGGDLILSSGQGTGTAGSNVIFDASVASSSGATANAPAEVMRLAGGNLGLGTTSPNVWTGQTFDGVNEQIYGGPSSRLVLNSSTGYTDLYMIAGNAGTDQKIFDFLNASGTLNLVRRADNFLSGSYVQTWLANGNVGFGNTAPVTKLDVGGTVKIADGGETCGSTIAGGIRYTGGDLQYCDGTAWQTISSTSSTGGVAAAGTTGEVQFNNGGLLDADANYFWDNTNKRLGIGTSAPTHQLTLAPSATGLALYNTADQTVNYERGVLEWTSNQLRLATEHGGSGAIRNIYIGVPGTIGATDIASMTWSYNGSPGKITASVSSSGPGASPLYDVIGTSASGAGTTIFGGFLPTINESGTAGYTALLINPTETAVGTGTRLLQDWQVGGTSKASLTDAGYFGLATSAPLAALDVQSGVTASAGTAYGTRLQQTLTAAANNDTLYGLYINPTYAPGSYTGVTDYDLAFAGGAARTIAVTGNGSGSGSGLTVQAGGTSGGTNIAGGDLTLSSGQGTGSAGSNIIFKTSVAGTSGAASNAPTEAMRIANNGYVGIHTANPTATLTVVGSQSGSLTYADSTVGGGGSPTLGLSTGASSGGNAGAYMSLAGKLESWVNLTATNNTSGQRVMRFGNSSNGCTNCFSIESLNDAGNTITYTPFQLSNAAPTNSLFIGSTGATGIGTGSPATRLDVAGTVRVANGGEACTSATYAGGIRYIAGTLQYCDGTAWQTISSTSSTSGVAAAGSTGDVQFNNGGVLGADNTNFFWDNTNKRLGIGTAAPGSALQVAGNITLNSASYLQFNGATNNGVWSIGRNNGSVNKSFVTGSSMNLLTDQTLLEGIVLGSAGGSSTLELSTGDYRAYFRGKVGIGIAGALAPLDVGLGVTAASGIAYGARLQQTLTAAANNDTLYGLYINPTYTPGSYTGVTDYDLAYAAGANRTEAVLNNASTAGNSFTIQAGGTNGGTDIAGGDLILKAGQSTGAAESKILFEGPLIGGSGTTTHAPAEVGRVTGGGFVEFTGLENSGDTMLQAIGTASPGSGTRMFWYPYKAAFRAGVTSSASMNDANIGNESAAFGSNTVASGLHSFATGYGATASGSTSFAMGQNVTASAGGSMALGFDAVASGGGSLAIGLNSSSTTTYPTVSGTGSYGIFMGDQHNDVVSAGNAMALMGGDMIINPAVGGGLTVSSVPVALDVVGTAMVGNGGETCGSMVAGGIRYTAGLLQYCDGGGTWLTISASGGVGGNPWSSLTAPTANLALAMGAYTTTWTAGAATTGNVFTMTDTASNVGTGYLLNVVTASGSALSPFHVNAGGTIDAITVLANGNVGIRNTAPAYQLSVGTASSAYPPFHVASQAGYDSFLVTQSGSIGMGNATLQAGLDVANGGIKGASGPGVIGTQLRQPINATANNDALYGLYINPTYTPGSYTGVTDYDLAYAAGANRTEAVLNNASTAGNSFTIQAGGTNGGTDIAGGDLILKAGQSTGAAESKIVFQGPVIGASGTTLHAPAEIGRITGGGFVWFPSPYSGGNGETMAQAIGTATPGAGNRMMWYPGKGAFRAGGVSGGTWDDGNIGAMSVSFGNNANAKGSNSFAEGVTAGASGSQSVAMGSSVTASGTDSLTFGSYTTVSGSYSAGLGLTSINTTSFPTVSGTGSYGIFMQDQHNEILSANNVMALLGGQMLIDPTSGAGATVSSVYTALQVNGAIKIGNDTDTCGSNYAGGIRYTAGLLQYCDGGGTWLTISASGGVGGNPWSSLTAPTANLALAMGAYTTTFTYGAATSGNQFTLQDTASDTGTGYLLNVATASGSTLKPFHVGAAAVDALTVLANGYVGVGTAAPSQQLTISSAGQAAWDNGSGTADVGLKRAATGTLQITNGSSGTGKVWADYGSYTAPAYSFANQTNSGMYGRSTFADFAFTSGGVSIWSMWTGGVFTRGDTYIGWSDSTSGDIIGSGTNTRLFRDANGIIAQRNATAAQIFRVYNTYTSGTNYERGVVDWATTANVLSIGTEAAGSGVLRNIDLIGGNVGIGTAAPLAALDVQRGETAASGIAYGARLQQTLTAAANSDTLYGLYINPTYTPGSYTGVTDYDLAFAGGANRTIAVTNNASSAGNNLTIQAGGANNGTNLAGGTINLIAGQSTGSGGSSIVFETAQGGSSGTAANAPTTRWTIDQYGGLTNATGQVIAAYDTNVSTYAFSSVGSTYITAGSGSASSSNIYLKPSGAGHVGIGQVGAATMLDVAGTLKIANGGETCGSSYAGAIRWVSPSIQYCDGTSWQNVAGSGSGGVAAAGSTGDVQFNNGGVLGADNTNFFWDNTNKRLGIGTITPTAPLQIGIDSATLSSPTIVLGTGANAATFETFSGTRAMIGYSAGGNGGNGSMTLNGGSNKGFDFYTGSSGAFASGTDLLSIYASTKIGINTATPTAALDVLNVVTAASGIAYGTRLQQTLTAAANNDTLYGLYINPTYTPGSYSGVTDYDLAYAAGANRMEAVLNNASAAGNSLTIQAGGTNGGTNIAGGDLILKSGQSTGTAESKILFEGPFIGASGTTTHAPAEVGRVTGGGFVQFAGTYGGGDTMAQAIGTATPGSGVRTFWYPNKAAFRAGNTSATQWDDSNVGPYSVAFGDSNTASGGWSSALGAYSFATGSYSSTIGYGLTAGGQSSVAMGKNALATGNNSFAFGISSNTSTSYPTVAGTGSYGIFMQDQHNETLSANNVMALLGGQMLIDPTSGAQATVSSVYTALQVNGSMKLGNGGETCGSSYAGAIRWVSPSIQYCDGTSWQNVAGSGSGGVAAAGTTGQVQFNNAGVLAADSNYFWDNTNKRLGIGTASPQSNLDVRASGGAQMTVGAASSGALVTIRGDSVAKIAGSGGSGLELSADSGSVQVGGLAGITPPTTATTFIIEGVSGLTAPLTTWQNSGGTVLDAVNTAGLFGVGIAAPLAALDVQAHITAASGIAYGTRLQQTLTAAANNDTLYGLYINPTYTPGSYTGVTDYDLAFGGSANRTIAVMGNGASAGSGLTVKAGDTTGGTNIAGGDLTLSAGQSSGSAGSNIYFKTAIAGASGAASQTPTQILQIDNYGNIDVGTAGAPARILNFQQGTNGTAGNTASLRADYNNLYLSNASGHVVLENATSKSNSLIIQEGANPYNGGNWWYDGVSGGGTGMWFGFNFASAAGNVNFELGDAAGGDLFRIYNSNQVAKFVVDSNGKTAVGQASATTQLDVAGTVRVADGGETCGSLVAGGIRYTVGTLQYCDGTAWQTVSSSGAGGTAAAGSTGDVQFNNGGVLGADNTNFFWDQTDKRLGLGTNAPAYMLDVAGDIRLSNNHYLWINDASGTAARVIGIDNFGYMRVGSGGNTNVSSIVFDLYNKPSVLNISPSGYAGFGVQPTAGLDEQTGVTAVSGTAYGTRLQQTLTAAANNDVLYGLYINPTYTPGSYTGVTDYDLAFAAGANRTIAVMNNASSAGGSLTIQAGGANGGTNMAGGNVNIIAGQSTGTSGSSISFATTVGYTSGTTANTPNTVWTMNPYGSLIGGGGTINMAYDTNVSGFAYSSSTATTITSGLGNGNAYNIVLKPSSTGMVGIGTASPTAMLTVAGDINYTGTITATSDIRLKKDIVPLDAKMILMRLAQIKTYSFRYKTDPSQRLQYGVMAQEIENVFPELVVTANDNMHTKSVNYIGLIAPLIDASQTMKADNDNLRAQVADLKAQQKDTVQTLAQMQKDIRGMKAQSGYGVGRADMTGVIVPGAIAAAGFAGGVAFRRRRRRDGEKE